MSAKPALKQQTEERGGRSQQAPAQKRKQLEEKCERRARKGQAGRNIRVEKAKLRRPTRGGMVTIKSAAAATSENPPTRSPVRRGDKLSKIIRRYDKREGLRVVPQFVKDHVREKLAEDCEEKQSAKRGTPKTPGLLQSDLLAGSQKIKHHQPA